MSKLLDSVRWKIKATPLKEHPVEDFYNTVLLILERDVPEIEARKAVLECFKVLRSEGLGRMVRGRAGRPTRFVPTAVSMGQTIEARLQILTEALELIQRNPSNAPTWIEAIASDALRKVA